MDNSTGTALFRELANDGEELGDTNFCTVIATAVVFGKTFEQANKLLIKHAKKRYIISVRQHVAGVVDNTVHDWTNGKANRAQQLIEFTPRETVELIPETSDVSGYNEWNNRLAKMLTA